MALNKREKKLMTIIGILGLLFGAIFLLTGGASSSTVLRDNLTKIKADLAKLQAGAPDPKKATVLMNEWKTHSLPWNQTAAIRIYRQWMTKMANGLGIKIDDIKATNPKLVKGQGQDKRPIYTELPFTIKAKATLNELTQFLYAFHSAGFIHKINSLQITPTTSADGKLDLNLRVQTLLLPGTPDNSDSQGQKPDRPPLLTLAEYQKDIVGRDVFQTYVAQTKKQPPGDPGPGREGPTRQAMPYNFASLTYVTSIVVDKDGKPEVWLHLVASDEPLLRAKEGKRFVSTKYPVVTGTVVKINTNDVVLDVGGPQLIRVYMGDNLATGYAVPKQSEVTKSENAGAVNQ
jgi:hypothetical protein